MSDAPNMIDVTIDNVQASAPQGVLAIRATEQASIRIPRSCNHPLPVLMAAYRQCLVEIGIPDRNAGELCSMPKPQPSCTQTATPGMVIKTRHTSGVIDRAQRDVMEFLFINHPSDCPVCDKDDEYPLQNQVLTKGRGKSRSTDAKRMFKKLPCLTSQIPLDREHYVLYQRCVRFGKETSGDAFMDLQGRDGGIASTEHHYLMGEQIGSFNSTTFNFFDPKAKEVSTSSLSSPYDTDAIVGSTNEDEVSVTERDMSDQASASYFLGNITQICPVSTLIAAPYRFRARPFDLASTASVTEHDAPGSTVCQDVCRGEVVRRMSDSDPEINEEQVANKDRFASEWDKAGRPTTPLVHEDGKLVPTSWFDALDRVRTGLEQAGPPVGFLPDGHLILEDVWAWSKSARAAVGSDSIDFRSRRSSEEERSLPASYMAGSGLETIYADLESASQVLLVALEPKDECGAVSLRLCRITRESDLKVVAVASFTSVGSREAKARLLRVALGSEPGVANTITVDSVYAGMAEVLSGGTVLVDEHATQTLGLLSSVIALAECTGARPAWVPHRANDRTAIKAGLLPGLFPFGRSLDEAGAQSLGWDEPPGCGLDTEQMIGAAALGELQALVVGGVDVRDFSEPAAVRETFGEVSFLVSPEVRTLEIIDRVDIVLPVAPAVKKNGTYINQESRPYLFDQARSVTSLADHDMLVHLTEEFDFDLDITALVDLYEEVNPLMKWGGALQEFTSMSAQAPAAVGKGQVVLASHKPMTGTGRLQDGTPWLAGSVRCLVLLTSAVTLAAAGITPDADATLETERGTITPPAMIADLPDSVAWVPECSTGSATHENLGGAGTVITLCATQEVAR